MKTLPDISKDPLSKKVIKRPLPVKVSFAKTDGICKTLEGSVAFRVGDAIITGVAGEDWPMQRARFDEYYEPSGEGGSSYVKKPMLAFALPLNAPVDVNMPSGGLLHGMPGDWLIQYALGDYGIVKDEIFRATYDFI